MMSSHGQGLFEVMVIPESNCKCFNFYLEEGRVPSTERILVIFCHYSSYPKISLAGWD